AHKFHTCSLRSIFFAAHVAEENDWTFFRRAIGETLRGSLKAGRGRRSNSLSPIFFFQILIDKTGNT
ncbi:MAG: hypothetical protein UET87_05845, partial [Oscillospiraceae bacterium]|nr:hypothetical protein [Oscillospiraceae bacterium]